MKKPSEQILKQARKLGLRLKVKKNGKLVYKPEIILKRQIKNKKDKQRKIKYTKKNK